MIQNSLLRFDIPVHGLGLVLGKRHAVLRLESSYVDTVILVRFLFVLSKFDLKYSLTICFSYV